MFAFLGVTLPVALAAGIAARRPVPTLNSLPAGLFGETPQFAATVWSRSDLFAKTPLHVSLLRERTDAGRLAVEPSAPKDFIAPDLLVYWIAGDASVTDTIPDEAVLLGGFNVFTPLLLPAAAAQSEGKLILYSLADHEVVDVSKPISF